MPVHSSLGVRVRLCLKKKKTKQKTNSTSIVVLLERLKETMHLKTVIWRKKYTSLMMMGEDDCIDNAWLPKIFREAHGRKYYMPSNIHASLLGK